MPHPVPGQRPGDGNHRGTSALKGRYKQMSTRHRSGCFALSGQPGWAAFRIPGRCPGLVCFAPSGRSTMGSDPSHEKIPERSITTKCSPTKPFCAGSTQEHRNDEQHNNKRGNARNHGRGRPTLETADPGRPDPGRPGAPARAAAPCGNQWLIRYYDYLAAHLCLPFEARCPEDTGVIRPWTSNVTVVELLSPSGSSRARWNGAEVQGACGAPRQPRYR